MVGWSRRGTKGGFGSPDGRLKGVRKAVDGRGAARRDAPPQDARSPRRRDKPLCIASAWRLPCTTLLCPPCAAAPLLCGDPPRALPPPRCRPIVSRETFFGAKNAHHRGERRQITRKTPFSRDPTLNLAARTAFFAFFWREFASQKLFLTRWWKICFLRLVLLLLDAGSALTPLFFDFSALFLLLRAFCGFLRLCIGGNVSCETMTFCAAGVAFLTLAGASWRKKTLKVLLGTIFALFGAFLRTLPADFCGFLGDLRKKR